MISGGTGIANRIKAVIFRTDRILLEPLTVATL